MPTPILDALRKFEAVAHAAIAVAPQTVSDRDLSAQVTAAVAANPTIAVVEVKSPWTSPTTWAQILATLASVLALFHIVLTPELQASLIEAAVPVVTAVTALYTLYRKWTSATVSTSAVAPQKTGG